MTPEEIATLRLMATTAGLVSLTGKELSTLLLERDHLAAEAKALRKAARAALADLGRNSLDVSRCSECDGSGRFYPYCSMCGDSTWDHECPSAKPCKRCEGKGRLASVEALRALLEAP